VLLEHPADAKEKLDAAIQHAAKAITEGRDAVQSLRASTVERNDLAVAIRTLGDELATNQVLTSRSLQCGSRRGDARSAPDRT
jgi:signal transduction histidine kinase